MIRPVWAVDGSDAAVVARIAAMIAQPGAKTLAVPGGATPRPIFAALAAMQLPWNTVTLLPGDERLVGDHHPASNLGQINAAFGATAAHVVPLTAGMALPPLDLAWLGVGDDGHIASLFPQPPVDAAAPPGVIRVTPDPLPAAAPFARLTLTVSASASAASIIIVARGAAKRRVLDAAIAGADLPVAHLFRQAPVTVYWSAA